MGIRWVKTSRVLIEVVLARGSPEINGALACTWVCSGTEILCPRDKLCLSPSTCWPHGGGGAQGGKLASSVSPCAGKVFRCSPADVDAPVRCRCPRGRQLVLKTFSRYNTARSTALAQSGACSVASRGGALGFTTH